MEQSIAYFFAGSLVTLSIEKNLTLKSPSCKKKLSVSEVFLEVNGCTQLS